LVPFVVVPEECNAAFELLIKPIDVALQPGDQVDQSD
jgi:hypothetical protein